ncbi:MAG: radical SAM protein [Clostridia bacterium]|nr:radical SAM protein [Clostridia bacterium]
MKNVYFVQTNSVFGSGVRSAYLPYSIGTIAAYAWADERIKNEYCLKKFIFMRDDVDTIVDGMDEPYFVGLSCYVWSMEFNKALARKIKEKYPDCLIVMGGHSISPDAKEMKEYPYIDFLTHGEGEVPTKALLLALCEGAELKNVPSLSFREGTKIVTTENAPVCDISDFPSPYLEGYFDEILKDTSIKYSVIWETNRGCPNRCAYCDWGVLKSRVRMFPMERLKAEIEWMAKNKIEYIYCSDANFGLFDRDEEITDLMIESKRKTGYPEKFKTNFTKNRDEFVFKLSCKMFDEGLGKSPTLSFQTMSPEALKNIGRTNMSLEHFKNLMQMYTNRGIMAYSELILGLPGETYESFSEGIETLFKCGQHKSVIVYPCELLPNSQLGSKESVENYQIKVCRTEFRQHHSAVDSNSIKEFSDNIISTYSMTLDDWKRSYIFALYAQGLHTMCLTMMIAIYLCNEKGIGYKQFYEGLINWSKENPETLCGELYRECADFVDAVIDGRDSFKSVFEGFGKTTWGFDEYLFMKGAVNPDRFYLDIKNYVASFDADEDIMSDLIKYQRGIIKKMNMTRMDIELNYDFEAYFDAVLNNKHAELIKRKNTVTVTEENPVTTIDEYAKEYVWYGRRDDAPVYSAKRNNLKVTY